MSDKNQPTGVTAWHHVSALEGITQTFYRDKPLKVPTIGAGYTPIVLGEGDVWRVRDGIAHHFKQAGAPLSTEQLKTLDRMAHALNNPGAQSERVMETGMEALSTVRLEGDKPKRLFDAVKKEYDDHAERAVGVDLYNSLPEGRRTALFALAYQSPAKMTEAGPDLRRAIQAKNWDAAADHLRAAGAKLKDPARYEASATLMQHPDLKGRAMVKKGRYLSHMAKDYGTTVDALKKANGLTSDDIRAGQILLLPSEATQKKSRNTDEALPAKQADPATRKMMEDFLKEGDPADEAMLKSPSVWTQDESEAVMKKRLAMKTSDPDYERYAKAERSFFDTHFGNDPVKTDETGKTLQPQPKAPLPLQATPVQTPDGTPLNKAIAKVGEHVTAHAQKQGLSKSVRGLQAGLNLLPSLAEAAQGGDWKQAASATVQAGSSLVGKGKGAQIAQLLGNAAAQAISASAAPLKTDGVAGPKTVQAARVATARHGAPKVKEATALGIFSEAARDPEVRTKPEVLKATVDKTIGTLFDERKAERSNPWGKGFQAALNDAGADVLGPSYEPIKEDGWIGPKTTGAFNQVANAAAPLDFAKRFGQGLGFW